MPFPIGTSNHTFASGLEQPHSLALLDEDIFWTSAASLKLYWTAKSNKKPAKKLALPIPKYTQADDNLLLLTTTPVIVVDHVCQRADYKVCSHICVPLSVSRFTCVCPIGMVFKDLSNSTCIEKRDCGFRWVFWEALAFFCIFFCVV